MVRTYQVLTLAPTDHPMAGVHSVRRRFAPDTCEPPATSTHHPLIRHLPPAPPQVLGL